MCRKNAEGLYCFKKREIAKNACCEACKNYDPDFEKIILHCSDLTIYSSEVRYPNILEIEYYHMQNAISDANQIKEFVFSKLIDFEQLQ